MSDRLPPLTALRAFEAAARHMSFAKAAAELHVTPAALSFQIKSLEEHLGVPVFHRLNRAVKLTEAGQALAPGVADGFEALSSAWRKTLRLQDANSLTVTAGPAFTSKWLAPRLYDFAMSHPEIDLRISASFRMMDLQRDAVDVAIRFTRDMPTNVYRMALGRQWFLPVMTPELARQYPTADSLTRAPLLIDESVGFLTPPCDWPAWFRANGMNFEPEHGVRFSQADHAIDAALAGYGVALGWRAVLAKDLYDGRLVAPVPVAIRTDAEFQFLCAKGAEDRPQIRALRDWILAEIDKTSSVSQGLTLIDAKDIPPA